MTRLAEITTSAPLAPTLRLTPPARKRHIVRQFAQFSIVGLVNTGIDLVVLNALLWLFAWHGLPLLLLANAIAYATGAVNSFLWNKYWTFGQRHHVTRGEVWRFVGLTLCGIAGNDVVLWLATRMLQPVLGATWLEANLAKVVAIVATLSISFVGMRLWVFTQRATRSTVTQPSSRQVRLTLSHVLAQQSLTVVLPAFNEEQVIATTIREILDVLSEWGADFEVLVVDDGSEDKTRAIVDDIAARDGHVRLIAHAVNQGYGAALVDGFAAATKDLTFFMDADGQFTIHDLAYLLVQIDQCDAVIGYRIVRQDTWLRKVNAWGWNHLVRLMLGVKARDLDCAFKLLRTDFIHEHPLASRGATINAELLYKLKHAGKTYCEVGVRHLPRQGGRATGARPGVILRALRDLLLQSSRWR